MGRRRTGGDDPEYEIMYKIIGENLRRMRFAKGYTQVVLARMSGLSRAAIVQIETGAQRVTLHTLMAVTETLDTWIQDVLPSREEVRRRLHVSTPSIGLTPRERAAINKLEIDETSIEKVAKFIGKWRKV